MTLSTPIPHTTLYANVAVIFLDIAGFVAHTSALTAVSYTHLTLPTTPYV